VFASSLLFKMFTIAATRLMRTFFVSARRRFARSSRAGLVGNKKKLFNSVLATARSLVAQRMMRALMLHQTPLRSPVTSLYHLL
jgi:hypothetical protein